MSNKFLIKSSEFAKLHLKELIGTIVEGEYMIFIDKMVVMLEPPHSLIVTMDDVEEVYDTQRRK